MVAMFKTHDWCEVFSTLKNLSTTDVRSKTISKRSPLCVTGKPRYLYDYLSICLHLQMWFLSPAARLVGGTWRLLWTFGLLVNLQKPLVAVSPHQALLGTSRRCFGAQCQNWFLAHPLGGSQFFCSFVIALSPFEVRAKPGGSPLRAKKSIFFASWFLRFGGAQAPRLSFHWRIINNPIRLIRGEYPFRMTSSAWFSQSLTISPSSTIHGLLS